MLSPKMTPDSKRVVALIRSGDMEKIQELVQMNQLRPNALLSGRLPVVFALEPKINMQLVELFLNAGTNVDGKVDEQTFLGFAIHKGSLELAKALLERGADIVGPVDERGFNALMAAVASGEEKMVQLILEYNASPEASLSTSEGELSAKLIAEKQSRENPSLLALLNASCRPILKAAKTTKSKAKTVERRKPGSHWMAEDFEALAQVLNKFVEGEPYKVDKIYDSLPQHGRITVQKHVLNAKNCMFEKTTAMESLSTQDWQQVVDRILEIAAERREGGQRRRKAKRDKSPSYSKEKLPEKRNRRDERAVQYTTDTTSFEPAVGYLWYPGDDILFAKQNGSLMESEKVDEKRVPSAAVMVQNSEEAMSRILQEIKERTKNK